MVDASSFRFQLGELECVSVSDGALNHSTSVTALSVAYSKTRRR
jgi:hypothetical protein